MSGNENLNTNLYLVMRLRSKKLGDPARLGIDRDLDLDLDDLEEADDDLLPLLELLELLRLDALDPDEEWLCERELRELALDDDSFLSLDLKDEKCC